MGDRKLAKVDNQPDVENTPLAPDNTTSHPEGDAQERHAHTTGVPQNPGEQQDAEPAWQGVPL